MEVNEIEKKIVEFWEKDKTFQKSLKKTKGKKPYVFYDGPPFATGAPHYGHILGSITKDLFGRFWTMKGRYVQRTWGWDCHGLPIENIAEKALKINSKDEIEKIGVSKFNNFCRSKVLEFEKVWKEFIPRIGRWVDMDKPYKTMDNEYIESVWWAFKQLWEKGFIYQGERVLMYCPRCSTPLAKAEIAMDNSYRNVKEDSVVVKFKLKDENAYALAWTTTPWTLPSNLALTVNPEMDYIYVKDKSNGEVYLIARSVLGNFFKDKKDYEIVKEIKGKKLAGLGYEPLFPYFRDTGSAFQFILGDFVTSEDGTGIVHTAPAFGEDDYNVCKKYGVSLVQPVDEKGRFTSEVPDFQGMFVHDSNKAVIDFLKKENKVVLVKKIEHEYPFCYRCDTKLIYRAIPAWFVDIQRIKPRVLELSKKINWYPGFLKEGRVKYTIETAPDWNISRNRYWATAIPIWVADDGEMLVIGSVKDLKKYAKNIKGKIDLHKDSLDKIILEKDGKKFKRVPEVLDCWFESGSMSFAQFHYPFENKKEFESSFPAQFIAEYIAQIRTWFYYMIVLSAILFDDIPFENVVTTGTILGNDGFKMSKSRNNFTDSNIILDKYGADALRFYLMSCSVMNAEDLVFLDKNVEEIYKKIILIIYNTSKFYETIKKGGASKISKSSDPTDKWILSRLNEFGLTVEKYLEEYNTTKACTEIKSFVEDLSTWYIRVNRERFDEDANARNVLRHVLETLSKTIAPILPFTSEFVFQSLNGEKKSVHLEEFPKFNKKLVNENLSSKMMQARNIVSSGLKERDKAQIGLKWPLQNIIVYMNGSENMKDLNGLIKSQLNVKGIEFESPSSKGTEFAVELNTNQTPELEAEGYARELMRQIQSERKKAGLVKKDKITLHIKIENFDLLKVISQQMKLIAKKVNAKDYSAGEIVKNEKSYKHKSELKIRDKNFIIFFNKIK